eukprot:7170389-Lingulodinium_polyedra.AAC.1
MNSCEWPSNDIHTTQCRGNSTATQTNVKLREMLARSPAKPAVLGRRTEIVARKPVAEPNASGWL